MTETNIRLPFTKIKIKRDSYYYYALPYVNKQNFIEPIPAGAKTCKLTPSTTLFFKKPQCLKFNFGWRKKSVIKIKQKEQKMYNLPEMYDLPFNRKAEAMLEHPIYKKYITRPYSPSSSFYFDQISPCFLNFYSDVGTCSAKKLFQLYARWSEYRKLTPQERVAAQLYKEGSDLQGDERSEMVLKKIYADRDKKSQTFFSKVAAFFDKPKSIPKKVITQPSAPAFYQPSYNPEYNSGQSVTVNNINNINVNVNIGCNLL